MKVRMLRYDAPANSMAATVLGQVAMESEELRKAVLAEGATPELQRLVRGTCTHPASLNQPFTPTSATSRQFVVGDAAVQWLGVGFDPLDESVICAVGTRQVRNPKSAVAAVKAASITLSVLQASPHLCPLPLASPHLGAP